MAACVQQPAVLLGVPSSPTTAVPPSRPPPSYEHPPAYSTDCTPGRGTDDAARTHAGPPRIVINRELLRARSPGSGSSSHLRALILACVVFWLCGFVFGAVAYILVGQWRYRYHYRRRGGSRGGEVTRVTSHPP